MKQIIRRWILVATMMLLNTQILLAQQTTKVNLSKENFNVEGWMLMGAGIAICLAGVLLFFLNKLFAGESFKKVKREKKEKNMTSLKTKLPKQEMNLEEGTKTIKLAEVGDASKIIKFYLEDQVTLGRNPQKCNMVIADDLTVSGAHCKLYIFDKKVYLMDLGSTNGTYVNGKQIRYAVVLKVGDCLKIGAREYRISW